MTNGLTNIHTAPWEDRGTWRLLDLSGEHLGVRLEEIPPGGTSSVHHYHTLEEEHVIALKGEATLVLGQDERTLQPGDHVWFRAGEELPHHIENRTAEPFRFLVFGERKTGDVVVYPESNVMLVKALQDSKLFDYERRKPPEDK